MFRIQTGTLNWKGPRPNTYSEIFSGNIRAEDFRISAASVLPFARRSSILNPNTAFPNPKEVVA